MNTVNSRRTGKSKNQPAQVFYVDIKNILKDHSAKKIKSSGVSVKCDGKTVSGMKASCNWCAVEKKEDPNKDIVFLSTTE